MKINKISKVTITESDLIKLINEKLSKEGLVAINTISIGIGTRTTGIGLGENSEQYITDFSIECREIETQEPYLVSDDIKGTYIYNPDYGDDRLCECSHSYYRHFDTYEKMDAVGCKYCECWEFKEKK